jgi:hypothetical protein
LNIASRYFGLGKTDGDVPELTEEEEAAARREYHRLHAPKHGPVRARWTTSGQQRRALARHQAAQARKANKRHRRTWIANEAAFQTLLAQILVVDRQVGSEALQDNTVNALEAKYGSYAAAREHLATLVSERIA